MVHYAEGKRRLAQVRFGWEKFKEETSAGTEDIKWRIADFALQHYWTSHHPWVVPEPFTLEPCGSYSRADIDEYAAIPDKIAEEAYNDPEFIKNAPYRSTLHKITDQFIADPDRIAITWRHYLKKKINWVRHAEKK